MSPLLKLLLPLAALLPLPALGGDRAPTPRHYDCFRTDDALVIDGRLDEAAWQQAPASEAFCDIRGEGWPTPAKATRVKMLWDKEHLYIAAELEEDDIRASLTERDSIIYHDNDFEVFLDPDGDGRNYFEIENNAFGTVMDLLMDRPYREGGNFSMPWDCRGLRLAVHAEGTVNESSDSDRKWCVEMAIPFAALVHEGCDPRVHAVWRVNFSRVQWVQSGAPEENWVWSPTGEVDMHMPAHWGYVHFRDGRVVKNWAWLRLQPGETAAALRARFAELRRSGISAALFEGYDERTFRLCREAGLEAHLWKWTLNRAELLDAHPEWYAMNRLGESCADKPPYVDYYRFLCPSRPEVAAYLADDFLAAAHLPHVDGVHLDYVRLPDLLLPPALLGKYGLTHGRALPQYDYCYCGHCCALFREQAGRDPLEPACPMDDPAWEQFRLRAVGRVVEAIAARLRAEGRFVSAAVFPGPSMARRMVRQDWGAWPLDACFPMLYNGFYNEGTDWIGRCVAEAVHATGGKRPIYAGLMCPDLKGDAFERALDAAFDHGASGVSFFDGPDPTQLERLRLYLERRGFRAAE